MTDRSLCSDELVEATNSEVTATVNVMNGSYASVVVVRNIKGFEYEDEASISSDFFCPGLSQLSRPLFATFHILPFYYHASALH